MKILLLFFFRKFTGFTPDSRWTEEAELLLNEIVNKETFNSSHYFTAIYGSPYKIMHEKNEIWFEQKRTMDPPERESSSGWVLRTAGQALQTTIGGVSRIGGLTSFIKRSPLKSLKASC